MLSRSRSLALALACGLVAFACADDKGESGGASTASTPSATEATAGSSTGPTTSTSTADPTTSTTSSTDESGSSGTSTGAPDGPGYCQEVCQADANCTMAGVGVGFICQGARCINTAGACLADSQCWAASTGWTTPCASQAECPGQVCIDIGGGVGRCATPPSDVMPCAAVMQEAVLIRAIEGDQQITVCADTDQVCDDSVCRDPCEDDLSCAGIPSRPHCNVGTGECECTSDEQCLNSGVAGWTRCNGGVCGCSVDKDCAGNFNTDACIDGFCGCSTAATCTIKSFDGTTPVCEPA